MKKSQKKHLKKYKPVSLDPFESVAAQILSGNLILKESKDGGFALFNKENIPVAYQVKENTLELIQNKDVPVDNLTVTMPAKNPLKSLKVQISSGDLVCKDIKAENVDIELKTGSLTLNKVNFASGKAELTKGKLYAKGDLLDSFSFSRKAAPEAQPVQEEDENQDEPAPAAEE